MNEFILGVDIETSSAHDIRNGAWAYSQHESTIVYCVAFSLAWNSFPKRANIEWEPGDDWPQPILEHIRGGGKVLAHNVGFEKSIFTNILTPHHDFPVIKSEQWIDTQAMGNAINMPASLGGLALALGCSVQKDTEGAALMRKMAKAISRDDGYIYPYDTPKNRRRLVEYCSVDVGTMMDAYYKMKPLSEMEQKIWEVDQVINERGVFLDQEFAQKCASITDERSAELATEAFEISEGELPNSTGSPALKTWLESREISLPLANRKRKDGTFVKTPTANRQALEELLEGELPDDVRSIFNNRMEANKVASLSKLKRVPLMVGFDGRLRFSLSYSGTSTGRWIAYGLQVQNMPKTKLSREGFELVRELLQRGSLEGLKMVTDRPLEAISQCLRSVVASPPGHDLISGDFSSIEARGVAWLAEQNDVIDRFHEGADIYIYTAKSIGSDNRQLGKVCTLALGFGMGPLKFHVEAAKYGITLELKEAKRIQKLWRSNNHKIVEFWDDLENACRGAILDMGVGSHTTRRVGRLAMWCKKECLFIRLPSGRTLRYWRPSVKFTTRDIKTVDDEGNIVETKMTSHEIQYYSVGKDKSTMQLDFLYGGKIADHVTQALARDLLACAVLRIESTDPYDVVIHIHDSVCAEVPTGAGDVNEFCTLMEQLPTWADGMPVAVEGYRDQCFRG